MTRTVEDQYGFNPELVGLLIFYQSNDDQHLWLDFRGHPVREGDKLDYAESGHGGP